MLFASLRLTAAAFTRCRSAGWLPLAVLGLLVLAVPGRAATRNVPSSYATIQSAINASQSGDTVLIADGTYSGPGNVDLDFGGRNITVTSQNGPATTIINCGGSSSANHRGFYLHSHETNAVISGLTIQNGYETPYSTESQSALMGGAIYNSSVSMTVLNCIIRNNRAGYGSGIDNNNCGPITVTNCAFIGNLGSGINNTNTVSNGSALTVTNCTFTGNPVGSSGALYNYVSDKTPTILTNDIFYGDTTDAFNSPVKEVLSYSAVTATDCDIQGGYAGIGNIDADPLFFNGSADVHLQAGSPCLGAGTTAGAPATTLDGRVRPDPPSIGAYELVPPGTAAPTTTTLSSYPNMSFLGQTVTFPAHVMRAGNLPTGTVTFTVDGVAQAVVPLSNGYDATYTSSSLPVGSHTVIAAYSGDATFAPSASAPVTQKVITHVSPHYVSPAGSDDNPGTQDAPKLTIQSAVNATLSGDTVIVEDGTYAGPGDVDVDFGGRNITVTSQNGAATTIIDCGGSSAAFHRGFYLHSYETNAVISGLTVQNGYEGSIDRYGGGYGGAIYNSSRGLTVQGCVLKNNAAVGAVGGGYGGGIYSGTPDNSVFRVASCTFTGNTASAGGGIYDGQGSSTFTVTSCTFTGNAAGSGGGLCNSNGGSGTASLTNCVFTGNTAGSGGGIYNGNLGSGTFTVMDCTLTANSANSGSGGGLYNFNSYNSTGATSTLTNDILYGDTGGEVNTGSPGMFSHCDIQGVYAGAGNINADPVFPDSPTDLHLQAGSPCLGAGTAVGAPATTIDGRTRPTPPSIGAYEAALTGVAAATTTLTSSLNPSSYGQSVTLTVVVAGQGGTPTGAVAFSINGSVWAHRTLSGGAASYSLPTLGSGSYVVTAIYTGDAAYAPGKSAPLTQLVQGIPTVTTLTSTPNPSGYEQQITFRATVTGGSSPLGAVFFTDTTSGTVLGAMSLTNGTATLFYSTLSGGSHQIVASYAGDGQSEASDSSPLTQMVTKSGTAISVTSSLNPSLGSQAVTFSASLKNTGYGGVPTGTVTFSVDGVAQAVVPLSNGYTASYTTSALTDGPHAITASYGGDSNFTASASTPVTQTVVTHISPQYVSPSGSDGSPGTQAAPKLTIQSAVNATLSGDTVIVEDGTYAGPGDVDVDFGGRNITVTSQNGAATTIIDCGGSSAAFHRGFYLHSYETNAVISGLTIQNGYEGSNGAFGGGYGGAIYNFGAGLTVQGCVLKNNAAVGGSGGGLYIYTEGSNPITLLNCVLTNNSASYGGGLSAATILSTITLTNCTLTGNSALTGHGGGVASNNIGYPANSGTIKLTDDILYGDAGGECAFSGTAIAASYCDIQGGYAGTGNINADPLFVNIAGGDFHLQPASPCFGAGTGAGAPTTDLDGNPRPSPPSIGAYEPVELAALAFPSPVSGGTVLTATVTLSGPAATDTVVGLSSSDPSVVRVFRAVLIPAGSSSATVAINTFRSHVTKTVTIQATLGPVVQAQGLTITGR